MHKPSSLLHTALAMGLSLAFAGCGKSAEPAAAPGEAKTVSARALADAVHAVVAANRTVYTRLIVNRLQNDEQMIKATEHWKEDKTLLLPAQMLREGAQLVAESDATFSYSLQSQWPINRQNAPKSGAEKSGLQYVAEHAGDNYYAEETLGDRRYLTAVYADTAIAPACISCHNEHPDSPRSDFKAGDVMGGIVVRVPL